MSEQIDWSKAPEGAMVLLKHVRDGAYAVAESYGDESKTWHWPDPRYSFHLMPAMWRVVAERPAKPLWSGEGLPPVGTVLEAIDKEINGGTWSKMVVLAVGKHGQDDCLIVAEVIEGQSRPGAMVASLYTGWERSFRPIRTQDQITTDEREAAIRSMLSGFDSAKSWLVSDLAGFIYDKGFRKP